MAQAVGVALTTYAQYELGKRQPDLDKLLLIAQRLECSVDYLLGNNVSSFDQAIAKLQEMGILVIFDEDTITLSMTGKADDTITYMGISREEFTKRISRMLTDVESRLAEQRMLMLFTEIQHDATLLEITNLHLAEKYIAEMNKHDGNSILDDAVNTIIKKYLKEISQN